MSKTFCDILLLANLDRGTAVAILTTPKQLFLMGKPKNQGEQNGNRS